MTTVPTVYLTEELPDAEGKGKEGKLALPITLDSYHRLIVDNGYLTPHEATELQNMNNPYGVDPIYYKWETSRQRIAKMNRYLELLDKIDQEHIHGLIEEELRQKRLANERRNKHACHDLGAREFTLTYSPKWFSDEEARKQMSKAIDKLCKYYKDGDQRIISLRAVGEVGTNGLSHVHCFYKLLGGVKITDKNFKRAYPPWDTKVKQGPSGHKGGHHANVKHEADFLGYIEKQIEGAWLDVKVGGAEVA